MEDETLAVAGGRLGRTRIGIVQMGILLADNRHNRGWPKVQVLCDPCANDWRGEGMRQGGTGRFGVYVLGAFYNSWIRGNYMEMISFGDWRYGKH